MMTEEIISSLQNPKVKHVVALQQKSSLRRQEGLFVVEGQREIEHCIGCGYEINSLFVDVHHSPITTYHSSITYVTQQVYEKMAYRESTEGMIAIAKAKDHSLASLHLPHNPLIVVLERVEKPGNLGAVLRTAEAAHVGAVIMCAPLADLYNPNVIRASIGGVFSVPTAVCTSKECIDFLKEHGVSILTAQLQDSYPYYDYEMTNTTDIIMGTESTGLSQQWREAANAHIRIPLLGRLDSLNVSVSAAVLMYEAVRQRHIKI